ncbi:MAG TPA: four helix bundle protein, partial [Fimbriimonadaceae bacterium]|nr:four helix bundle protein [Fimbriimonadaceae bacterium]
MEIFEITKAFPKNEAYSLTDQIRRSSRACSALIAEGWGRRRYPAAFINKLSESEAEIMETQTWLRFCRDCGYLLTESHDKLIAEYELALRSLAAMINHSDSWTKNVARPGK